MKKKNRKLAAVLGALMLAESCSAFCGGIPVMAAEVTAADAAVISAEEVASAAAGRTEENAEAELAGQEDGAEQPAETPDMVPGETEIPSPEENGPVSAPDNGWRGPVLTRAKGVNRGPSGKETYYNLNMSRVVDAMHSLGFEGEYWIRDDGAKMFGQYILTAANLRKYPRGSLIETSLGTGIVADTGDFTRYGVAVDIAVDW